MIWFVLAVVVVVIALFPFLRPAMEKDTLTERIRAELPAHSFVPLTDGVTHYQWAGPEQGPKVVFVHGFSTPLFIWDNNFNALAEAGFRVLRYDLFGRGYSDRPPIRYTAEVFVRQLHDLMEALNIQEPVHLIGLSMGGGIVMNFLDHYPERVRKVVLFAPVGFNDRPPQTVMLRVPGLGEWIMRVLGERRFIQGVLTQLGDDPESAKRFREEYLRQFRFKGCQQALLSTLRHGPIAHQEAIYRRVGRHMRPGLLFWGDHDTVVPYTLHQPLLETVPWLKFHGIPSGLHTANYQRAREINPVLIDFLRDGSA